MRCPSRDRLVRASLGLEDLSDHLADCPRCQDDLEAMRGVIQQIQEGHAVFDRGHEGARERLLSLLPMGSPRPTTTTHRPSLFHWMGGSTMRRGIVFGAAASLALGMLWIGFAARRASAMNVVAEAVRKARTYQFTMTLDAVRETDAKKASPFLIARYYWAAPSSYRIETKGGLDGRHDLDHVAILPAGSPGIHIDNAKKTYQITPAQLGQVSPLMMLDALGSYSGRADRELGDKEVAGVPAKGFVIEATRIDTDATPGPMEIWVDAHSNLPILIRQELIQWGTLLVMDQFQWDADLPPSLFGVTPPKDYAEVKPPPSNLDDQVAKIVEGLKLYAKHSGGHYPRVKMLYGDVTRDELARLSKAPWPPKTDADFKDERISMIHRATWGFATINTILRDNADAAYYGKTVGPEDKDKVLLRWKAEGGGYHVVFGDLRFETVTPARLRTLEEGEGPK